MGESIFVLTSKKPGTASITSANTVIKTFKKSYLIPAEMESVVLLKKDVESIDDITVEVVE